MKPLIIYVDDEPNNLAVFEALIPNKWEIKTFSNPIKALQALENLTPSVIVSDQRMPDLVGVKFLELAKNLHPNSVRIIVTGYSEEDLVIESVRKAQIFDYIKKPWDPKDLEVSLSRAIDYYIINEEKRRLNEEIRKHEILLEQQNSELVKLAANLTESNQRETDLRKELECWVPPALLWLLQTKVNFPVVRNIVGITFDIVKSSKIHGIIIEGRPLRSCVIKIFSEAVLGHGGWRESHAGDSGYGHFGLFNQDIDPVKAGLSAALEFRTGLEKLRQKYSVSIECGIALHIAKDTMIEVHTVQLKTPKGLVIQKSFDTASNDVDILHRMEKLVHILRGTNIIMSEEFVNSLKQKPDNLVNLGHPSIKGIQDQIRLFLLSDPRINENEIDDFKRSIQPNLRKAA